MFDKETKDTIEPLIERSRLHDGVMLTLRCRKVDYCASRIAHAIEDCNVQMLGLKVEEDNENVGLLRVDIVVGGGRVETLARSLSRYGFDVVNFSGDEGEMETLQRRVNELMLYLNV